MECSLRIHHCEDVAYLPGVKIGAHLEIHFTEKQQVNTPDVKVLAHLGAETIVIGRSVGAAPSQV